MNFSFKNIPLPTPTKVKHYADTFLSVLGSSGMIAVIAEFPRLGAILTLIGLIAKGLSNGFKDESSIKTDNEANLAKSKDSNFDNIKI